MIGGLAYLLLLNCFVLMLFGFFGHRKQLTTYVVMSMCFSAPGNWALTLRAFPELQSCAPVVSLCFVALLILGLNADLLYIMLHGPVLSFYCTLRNIGTEKVPASVASVAAPVLTCGILVFLVLEKQPYFQLVFLASAERSSLLLSVALSACIAAPVLLLILRRVHLVERASLESLRLMRLITLVTVGLWGRCLSFVGVKLYNGSIFDNATGMFTPVCPLSKTVGIRITKLADDEKLRLLSELLQYNATQHEAVKSYACTAPARFF